MMIIKKIITVNFILLFFLFSGINTESNISAQMPSSDGDFLFEESECRSNPGTGEVFCDVSLDTSYQLMTQTVAPAEFYEGQGIWFQGCKNPEEDYENYDSVYIENHYVLEAGSAGIWGQKVTNFYNIDPKAKVTHILFRGNVRQEPGRQYIRCKYQFFTVNSPLVQPGMPYYNAQWEADKETQRMYEEAEKIRREADRARAEEELLRAKQEAELELQRQEEERKRLEKEKEQTGIQNLFEQVGQGPVADIFGDTFSWQPPSPDEVPIGPFINFKLIYSDDSLEKMDCIAKEVEFATGMSYEQAYMDFAFTLGVRPLEEPDFYYDAVTNCMQLNFSKLLSGIWENVAAYQSRPDLNIFLDKCVIPHLSDTLNLRRSIIVDDLNSVKEGKRSLSREEMLGAYDCLYHHLENIWPLPPGSNVNHYPNGQEMLADYILGSQEIPGEFCMVDTISDANQIYSPQAESIVFELVEYVVGRTDGWYFLEEEPNAKRRNDVLNIVIGCNNDLEWLKDYNASFYSNDQGVTLEDVFVRLAEPDFRQCILEEFIQFPSNMTNNEAETVYDTMLMGFMDHEDPTEYSNRPLGEEQYHAILDCSNRFKVDLSDVIIASYLWQYTLFIDEIKFTGIDNYPGNNFEKILACTENAFENSGFGDDLVSLADESAMHIITKIFYSGGNLNSSKPLARDYTDIELRAVYECLEEKPEFEWIDQFYNDQYDYEPVFESSLFTQSNVDFQEAAADFRQNLSDNTSSINNINTQSPVSNNGNPIEILRLELIDLARGSIAEDCMVANLAREKGETENYIKSSYINNLIWEPQVRPSSDEKIALQNCESQIRSATQGKGGLSVLLKYGSFGDPDYLSRPSDSQRACMINEYKNVFGYMIEKNGFDVDSSVSKAISEFSLPGSYEGYHPILSDTPNLRPPSSIELEAISNCRVEDLFIYEGDRLRKLIPGINTAALPIGDLATPTGLAIVGIMITLFFSTLQMIRGK